MWANWTSISGRGSTFAPASISVIGPPTAGSTAASPGRRTPGMRRIENVDAASSAPVEPAETAACAQPSRTADAATTIDDSGFERTAPAGSSLKAICSGACRSVTPARQLPAVLRADRGRIADEHDLEAPGDDGVARAHADLGRRAIAAHGVERDRDDAHRRPAGQTEAAWYARSRYVPQVGQTRWASFGDLQRSQVATAAAAIPC